MKLYPPMMISSRLLPAVKVGDGAISIEYHTRRDPADDRRTRYRVFIDAPDLEYEDTTCRSGCQGGTLQEGLASFLGFLSYAVEHARYVLSHPGADDGDDPLFPQNVLDWASEYADGPGGEPQPDRRIAPCNSNWQLSRRPSPTKQSGSPSPPANSPGHWTSIGTGMSTT